MRGLFAILIVKIISILQHISENYNAWNCDTMANLCKTTDTLGVCKNNSQFSCIDNSNCPGSVCIKPNVMCSVDQSKFRRDMQRVVNASTMVRGINKAKAFAGVFPIIPKETFIPGLSSSKWPTWGSFMGQLGIETVVDPLNSYAGCVATADPATCWDVKSKQYQCSAASSVYHYRTINSGADFALGIPLEQSVVEQGQWAGMWIAGVQQKIKNDFCVGQPVVAQAVCGDGLLAAGTGEQCDPPGKQVSGEDANPYGITCTYGKFVASCNKTCKVENVQCVNLCGNGIIDDLEVCDDGAKYNGQYNHCAKDCSAKSNEFGSCGNGKIDKNEVCDIATPTGRVFLTSQTYTSPNNGTGSLFYDGLRCVKKADGTYDSVNFDEPKNLFTTLKNVNTPWTDSLIPSLWDSETVANVCSGKADSKYYGVCEKHPQLSCYKGVCPSGDTCVDVFTGTKYALEQKNSCNWNCKATGSW
jgi:hypothetical protein